MKIRLEPYKTWSGGAKRLGLACGILRATPRQVKKHGDFDLIINWGRSERRFNGEYLNAPERVQKASGKLDACSIFGKAGVPQAEFTTEAGTANEWVKSGTTVLARTLTRASGGRGIVIINGGSDEKVPKAPLYVQYMPKKDEYRVHVWKGEVIYVQQKKRKLDVPDDEVNWQIRNHDNGFIFANGSVNPPKRVLTAAIAAVEALELDFGAVDVGWNNKKQACCVYEVNTAPGLEGSTLKAYRSAVFKTYPAVRSGMYAKRRQRRGVAGV